jgi:hypothetical protein
MSMKTRVTSPVIILCCIALLMACEQELPIAPVHEQEAPAVQSHTNKSTDDAAGGRKSDLPDPFTSAVTGTIDGRGFTGNLSVTEFIEQDGALYANLRLSDVKITGKDHKYLEYILERENYSVPVTVGDMVLSAGTSQSARTSQIAATCTILTLNFAVLSVDVLGLAVQIDLVTITINANDDEPLGNLICTALDTLTNVTDLVELLNQILGLLTL